jgi:hypothetical protein
MGRESACHDRSVDFYVGPAVLSLEEDTVGVTAFIDASKARGMYSWGGFLDTGTHDEELRFRAIEARQPFLALPGREFKAIDVVYTTAEGIGFMGIGLSPMEAQERHES